MCAMTDDVRAPGRAPAALPFLAGAAERDPVVDVARVVCVITVVCSHVLMVTLTADPATGQIRSVLVPTLQPWYW